MSKSKMKLMVPGPVEVEQDVLEVMGGPVQLHYGPDGVELYNSTTKMLKPVFGTEGDVFVMVGSGSPLRRSILAKRAQNSRPPSGSVASRVATNG